MVFRQYRRIVLAVAATVLACGGQLVLAPTASADSRTVHVDCSRSQQGEDTKDRPITSIPALNAITLHPGDMVLFQRGTSCSGQLELDDSGTAGNPITVDAYGSGSKPRINAAGNENAVWVHNAEHVRISDLELVAPGDNIQPRRGLYVQGVNTGDLHGITAQRLDIHDVRGVLPSATGGDDSHGKYANASGGIIVEAGGTDKPTSFPGLRLQNNTVHAVDRAGIYLWSNWCRRPQLAQFWHSLCTGKWHPLRDMVIEHNRIADVGGDGVVPNTSANVLVQHNTLDGFNRRADSPNAGMWTANSDDVTFQFNRASGGHGTQDSQGFDVDHSTNRVVFQYNISSDNDGGFFLLCPYGATVPGHAKDFTVRYNLSVNDRTRTFQVCSGGLERGRIHNNTIFLPDRLGQDQTQRILLETAEQPGGLDVRFVNNLLRRAGDRGTFRWTLHDPAFVLDHNLISGVPVPPQATGTVTDPPLLADPGSATDSPADYRLLPESPAVGAGVPMQHNGGRDFFGDPIGNPPSIGFDEGQPGA